MRGCTKNRELILIPSILLGIRFWDQEQGYSKNKLFSWLLKDTTYDLLQIYYIPSPYLECEKLRFCPLGRQHNVGVKILVSAVRLSRCVSRLQHLQDVNVGKLPNLSESASVSSL